MPEEIEEERNENGPDVFMVWSKQQHQNKCEHRSFTTNQLCARTDLRRGGVAT